jgi:uncharacterized protein (UPF0332 family)
MDISTKQTIIRVKTVFHVATAALLWLDIERTKHSAVQASFNESVVKPGLVEVEYGQLYRKAREWREERDYSDVSRLLDEPTEQPKS